MKGISMSKPIEAYGSVTNGKGLTMSFYHDPSLPSTNPEHRYTLAVYEGKPDSVDFEVQAHWHKHHEEYFSVIEGHVTAMLDGVKIELEPGMEELIINRGVVHSFKGPRGQRAVIRERTSPEGAFKQK